MVFNGTDLARVDLGGAEGIVVGTHLDRSECPMLYLSSMWWVMEALIAKSSLNVRRTGLAQLCAWRRQEYEYGAVTVCVRNLRQSTVTFTRRDDRRSWRFRLKSGTV